MLAIWIIHLKIIIILNETYSRLLWHLPWIQIPYHHISGSFYKQPYILCRLSTVDQHISWNTSNNRHSDNTTTTMDDLIASNSYDTSENSNWLRPPWLIRWQNQNTNWTLWPLQNHTPIWSTNKFIRNLFINQCSTSFVRVSTCEVIKCADQGNGFFDVRYCFPSGFSPFATW